MWWSRKTQHTKTYAPRPTRLHPARTVPLLRHSDLPPLGSEYGRSNEDEQSGSSERPAPPRSSRWRETRQASQSEGTLRKVQRSLRQIPSVRKGREETPRGFFFAPRVGILNDRKLVKFFLVFWQGCAIVRSWKSPRCPPTTLSSSPSPNPLGTPMASTLGRGLNGKTRRGGLCSPLSTETVSTTVSAFSSPPVRTARWRRLACPASWSMRMAWLRMTSFSIPLPHKQRGRVGMSIDRKLVKNLLCKRQKSVSVSVL